LKITLLVIGKTVKGWISDGLFVYCSRLKHYVNFEIKEIPELKNVASFTKEQIKEKEGDLILRALKPEDNVILLDEHGAEYTSVQFAQRLQQCLNSGRSVVYVVGGAYGFSEKVYSRADSRISLGKMTLSHQMVRVVFAEQVYRAFTIINGEPYHHE